MLKTTASLRAVTLSPGGFLPLSSTFSSMITAEVQQGCQTHTEEGVSWAHTPGLPTSALLETLLVLGRNHQGSILAHSAQHGPVHRGYNTPAIVAGDGKTPESPSKTGLHLCPHAHQSSERDRKRGYFAPDT